LRKKKILQRNEERKKYPAEHLGGEKISCPPGCKEKKLADQGPVSRKPRKVFGPVKPLLNHLYLKAEKCIRLKLLG